MKNKRSVVLILSAVAFFAIPIVAMQLSSRVNWTTINYVVMGALVIGTVVTAEVVARKVESQTLRVIISFIIMIIFMLVWAELSVGIFGTPFAGN